MKKTCKNCKAGFETENKRKIYCSDSCKVDAYRKRNGIQAPTFIKDYTEKRATSSSLTKREITQTAIAQVSGDQEYRKLKEDERVLADGLRLLLNKKSQLLNKYNELNNYRSQLDTFQQARELTHNIFTLLGTSASAQNIGIASTVMGGIFASRDNKNYSAINRRRVISLKAVEQQLKEIDPLINGATMQERTVKARIVAIEERKRKEIQQRAIQQPQAPNKQIVATNAIIPLSQLKELTFHNYEFGGSGFDEAIGNPEKDFKMSIYGESGNGKSTYAIEFANYLAVNHGKVLYNSSEEGIGLTLKRKLQKYDSENFNVSDCKDFKSLKKIIAKSGFQFIVIDSVNDMNMGPKDLKELYSLNPDKAFILILQATKGGQYKGSTEIVHDCDIIVKVEQYQPIVEKTRYR